MPPGLRLCSVRDWICAASSSLRRTKKSRSRKIRIPAKRNTPCNAPAARDHRAARRSLMATSTRQGTDRVGSGWLGCLLAVALLAGECAQAAEPADVQRLLTQAEEIKISDPQRFAQLLQELQQRSASLP